MKLMFYALLLAVIATYPVVAQTCYVCQRSASDLGEPYILATCVQTPNDHQTVGYAQCSGSEGAFAADCSLWGGQCETYSPPGSGHDPSNDDCTFNGGSGCSPILIKTGMGPWRLGQTPDVPFDFKGDGVLEYTSWTAADSDIGFLVLDHNQNGHVDFNDVFGNHGRPGGLNGFEYLSHIDVNHDGVLDATDWTWKYLRLWIDTNRNGNSETEEWHDLGEFGITALYLDYNMTGREDHSGNAFRYMAHLVRNGHIEPYYDVYFATAK